MYANIIALAYLDLTQGMYVIQDFLKKSETKIVPKQNHFQDQHTRHLLKIYFN